jgi:hypothetical protein
MKIASSSLQVAAAHAESRQTSVKESLQLWNGRRSLELSRESTRAEAEADASVAISASGQAAAAQAAAAAASSPLAGVAAGAAAVATLANGAPAAAESAAATDGTSLEEMDPKLLVIKLVVEQMTGQEIKLLHAEDAPSGAPRQGAAPRGAGMGMRYDLQAPYQESESRQFAPRGGVRTADGQEVAFSVQLSLSRSFSAQAGLHLQAGQAAKDPLVISFPGQVPQLTDTKFSFDLDADGRKEDISFVAPGSGFLVFDRNGDGRVNDGRELFGTRSGDGFAELAALDDDGNGWVDEGDAAFGSLRLWTRDAAGQDRLQGLLAANIGALSLQHAAAPYVFKNDSGTVQGAMRAAGVFLQEDGQGAGTVSQIDLAV